MFQQNSACHLLSSDQRWMDLYKKKFGWQFDNNFPIRYRTRKTGCHKKDATFDFHHVLINPIGAGGGLNQPALFSNVHFSMKKGFWRSQISWLFLIHYELSENQKKNFWFFTVFWGDLEGVGWISHPPPRSQATSRSPALFGLNINDKGISFNFKRSHKGFLIYFLLL